MGYRMVLQRLLEYCGKTRQILSGQLVVKLGDASNLNNEVQGSIQARHHQLFDGSLAVF